MLKTVVDLQTAAILQTEDKKDDRPHHILLGYVGDGEFDAIVHSADIVWMGDLIGLEDYSLFLLYWLFVASDEHIVIDTLVEIDVC